LKEDDDDDDSAFLPHSLSHKEHQTYGIAKFKCTFPIIISETIYGMNIISLDVTPVFVIFAGIFLFATAASRSALVPSYPTIQWVLRLFTGGKAAGLQS
jgi:hypothetical protein